MPTAPAVERPADDLYRRRLAVAGATQDTARRVSAMCNADTSATEAVAWQTLADQAAALLAAIEASPYGRLGWQPARQAQVDLASAASRSRDEARKWARAASPTPEGTDYEPRVMA